MKTANIILWIGTWGDGITVFNQEKNTYKHFKNDPSKPHSLSNNNAWKIYEDADKNIWVGTYGGGLNKYDPNTNSFIRYQYDEPNEQGLNSDKIHSIFDDGSGHLMIGTDGGGLNILNKNTGVFTHYLHSNLKNSIASNSIGTIYKDKTGIFWIGTDEGLSRFDSKSDHFTTYSTADGLPGNGIFGILQDDHSDLWISSDKGITRFNPGTKAVKNFRVVDGLQSNEFKESAYYQSSSGAFYFGGNNGFNIFYPDSIKQNNFDPPLVFTNFKIFNKEVSVALNDKDQSPLKKDITETDTITIPYNISVIQFEFASLNYTSNEKKQYAYMLDGFDKDWTILSGKRTATYTNLDPGKYIFQVKALNNNGRFSSQILKMELIITPPFWLTWWFKILVALVIIGGAFSFYKYRINSIQTQKNKLQQLVEQRTQQLQLLTEEERKARTEAEKANMAKSVFLATMSHELRTPMNGVIGMTSLLVETPLNDEQKEYASIIKTCGENLLNVINDILDFSKMESGNMELELADFDLRECIEEVLDVFAEKASKIGLDLVYQIDYNVPVSICGDRLRIRQILLNLVSNAIKFTKRGEIFVGVHLLNATQDGAIEIGFDVKDTGIGIPANKLSKLFKAFSQVDSSTTRKYGGTGLGLVISLRSW